MLQHQRHQLIRELLQNRGSVSVQDVADHLKCSAATVRRDFLELAQSGELSRIHGGAALPPRTLFEPTFREKQADAPTEKDDIARLACADIPGGKTVFVDAGTTCLRAGLLLLARGDLHLVTHSIPLLLAACESTCRVTALGGELRQVTRALVGALSLDWLKNLRFDYALLGASAIRDCGDVLTTEFLEASVKMEILRRSTHRFLLADTGKLQGKATVRFARLDDFQNWYTAGPLSAVDARRLCKSHSIQLKRPTRKSA